MAKQAGGLENGAILHIHTARSGIPSETVFEFETGMTPSSFEQKLDAFRLELTTKIDLVRDEIGEMNEGAARARAEHQEMDRKLREHEMQLHGVDGKSGLIIEVDRLKQGVKLAKWGLHLAGAMSGALAMLALEHFFK